MTIEKKAGIQIVKSTIHPVLNPTVYLFVFCLLAYSLNITGAMFWGFSENGLWAVSAFLNVILGILIFTPLHDAIHGSASSNLRINKIVLYFSGLPLVHSPVFFKSIHIIHHSQVNVDQKDPDHFTQSSSWAGSFIKSFFLFYYYYYFAIFVQNKRALKKEAILSLTGYSLILGSLFWSSCSKEIFFYLILPNFISIGILGFINTAWPHFPGKKEDIYKDTRILHVPRLLELLMCNQNFHLLHHLRPTMPWFLYKEFWSKNKKYLREKGIVEA